MIDVLNNIRVLSISPLIKTHNNDMYNPFYKE